jgi:hypothetical protein
LVLALAFSLYLLSPGNVQAYPEFQEYVKKTSGQAVNCALCHSHPDGPDGAASGQLGSLTPEEFTRLGLARSAFEPGRKVDSPILNDFGDSILRTVGKKKFLEIKRGPGELAAALGAQSDLDGDGISDAQEFLDGTHPLMEDSGHPWRLLRANLHRNLLDLGMLLAATLLMLYGLNHFLRGFASVFKEEEEEKD